MSALASWCARRRYVVLGAWLIVLVGLGAAALGLGAAYTNSTTLPDSESATASTLLAQANASGEPGASDDAPVKTGNIVWHSTDEAVDSAAVRTTMESALTRIAAEPGVVSVVSPYTAAGSTQLNRDADTAFARITVDEDADLDPVVETAESARAPNLEVETGGRAFTPQPAAGGATEGIGILAALVVLLVVFRSAWAAALPILTGAVGVVTSLFALMLLSHVVDLADSTPTMGALIGLGVGIDYALFIVNRYRKSLMAGGSVPDAVRESMNTSGRAVVFAGGTVVIALIAVFVVGIDILTGMARGAALTVVLTVVAALTLLPALLATLGTRVLSRRQRTQLAGTGRPAGGPLPAGARWAGLVDRKPALLALAAAVVTLALAIPALSIRLGSADASSDPDDSASHRYFTTMSAGFGEGIDAPLLLVATTPDTASTAAFRALTADVGRLDRVAAVSLRPATTAQPVSVATVIPTTSAQSEDTADLVTTLRDDVIPAAEQGTSMQVHVGGVTAANIDNAQATISKLPLYLGLVALLGFLLLAVAFRSILVPLIGAVTNLIVLAVGLAALTAVFQWGWASQLLGVGSGAPIESIVPVLLIGIMFGLSMDYQVFLVSRMHEEWAATGDNRRAVRVGLAETSRVIVAAALIMFCVFASFGFAGQRIIAEIGVGLGLAVLVDALLVRLVLMPALLRLIGRRAWWYPTWAERITPHLSVEGAPPVPARPAGYASTDGSGPALVGAGRPSGAGADGGDDGESGGTR